MPCISEFDGTSHGPATVAADPDRRVRLLHRLGLEFHLRKRVELAMILGIAIHPTDLEDANPLVGLRTTPIKVQAQGVEFLPHPPRPYITDDAPTGEDVERRHYLRRIQRVAVRHDEHAYT